MSDGKFRSEDNVRPPLLNGLIIVTLITVVVALGYLASYYLSAGNGGKPTWFSAQMFCEVPEDVCTAQLGRFGTMSFAIDSPEASPSPSFRVAIEGIEARQVDIVLEGRAQYSGTERITLAPQGNGVFTGEGLNSLCTVSATRWRAKVIAHTPKGLLGSWFDFDIPCAPTASPAL
ncbi:hypothetical protein [Phytohalomonas tamaricis]|uniref:hypothetical protein n=1 Tax=Phytohalomonas tamaricis TaxID=2081032 RepID=UPI000D0B7A80|nr:hypothetical protein [Phytohalomonas tamaricis]